MRYLIDTQILLWIFSEPAKLPSDVAQTIKRPKNELLVSTVSFWEIAIKSSLGKLTLPFPIDDLASETASNDISLLHIKVNHTLKVADLPHHHKDPFDRLIISQAIVESLPIISSDDKFSDYEINRVWK
jgi:PIN domain nuclease of toxin-antitoxin system